ncbi:conserved hypothetical protein [Estrella lausannensis]|uniref:Uncharacterized protein n=1 Tax=Estrella lausannensis TaxID=483423 RepID=A0A0H5DTX9_9BACT|nr:conserved hypothetical protein [Estrella lausannensis]
MHFGFVPPDFILKAECIQQSNELDDIKRTWKKMSVDLSNLNCYQISTNSTNSLISIFALGFRIITEDKTVAE